MKRLFLHIGMHKTGSTSIQRTLAAARLPAPFEFLQAGAPNGSLAVLRGFRPEIQASRRTGQNPPPPALVEELRKLGRGALDAAFAASRRDAPILSAEAFSTFSETEGRALGRYLAGHADHVRVVGYVRRPREFVSSAFQQHLKQNRVNIARKFITVAFKERFAAYDPVFGRENVDLVKYDRALLADRCVVTDFCRRIGLPLDRIDVLRSNEMLSLPAVQLLNAYRRVYPGARPGDRKIVSALTALPGSRFRLAAAHLGHIAHIDWEQVDWMEERLGATLRDEPEHDDSGLPDTLDELLAPAPAALDWLAERTGRAAAPMRDDPVSVAEAVAALRGAG